MNKIKWLYWYLWFFWNGKWFFLTQKPNPKSQYHKNRYAMFKHTLAYSKKFADLQA